MKKTVLWIIVVVMFLMLSVGLYADNSPPGLALLEECVLDAPGQLNPQLVITGNEMLFEIMEANPTIVALNTVEQSVIEFLFVSFDYTKVESIAKFIIQNLVHSTVFDYNRYEFDGVNYDNSGFV